jgi:hypothetical protein
VRRKVPTRPGDLVSEHVWHREPLEQGYDIGETFLQGGAILV